MAVPLILASCSDIRATLLRQAGLQFTVEPARVDESALRDALEAEGAPPRDIADALAALKAQKVGSKHPDAWTIGCDQVLEYEGQILSKPHSPQEALTQLQRLSGSTHRLLSAAVVYGDGAPLWRHIGQVRLTMRPLSDGYISAYVDRNWDSIRHAVGAYKLEEEGVRLFSRIEGDYFTVLGLPLLELLSYLITRGTVET